MPYLLIVNNKGQKKSFYTQSEIDNQFYTKTHIDTNYYTQGNINSEFYNKDQIKNMFVINYNSINNNHYTKDNIDNKFFNYYTKDNIDNKFSSYYNYINNNHYTKANINNNYYTKANIDTNYYTQTYINNNYYDINHIKDIVNKMLNGLKWSDGNTYENNYDQFYDGNVTIQQAIDHLANTLIRDNADTIKEHVEIIANQKILIDANKQSIAEQQKFIEANKRSIAEQQKFIEANKTEILNKILELREIVNKNKEQISLNTKEARPLAEVTTKIFNTLAAQANEEISLNTEVIEDNNELLNKTDKNNEADNNVLYVMVTALTAPFIGLSLYYSSDTEENIDNEIEAF